VAKDKCFYFSHSEDVDDEGDTKETKSHFDFGLYGNLNGVEYGSGEDNEHFAHAYYREELKANGCNPDIIAQQSGKDSNPHKTKHVDANNKFLGKYNGSSYHSEGIELAKELGIELDEAELVRTNSTGLTIYNPSNLANLIKGMKNKTQTREEKIALRKQYEQSLN
jgi:hypothetical protein